MLTHPETQPHEVFLGNTRLREWPRPHLATLTTIRLGAVAYSVDGKRLEQSEGMRPIFIARAEEPKYDAIMMARLSRIASGEVVK